MNRRIKKLLLTVFLLIALFAIADFALAANYWGDNTNGESFQQNAGLAPGSGDLRVLIANVIRAVLGFLGILAVCIIIYAGFVWMTAGGEADRVERAKKILINGVIGLILVVLSFAIVSFILNSIIGVIGPGGEPTPPCVGSECPVIVPSPPAPFSINGTVPWNTAINIIKNVEIKAFFNKDLDNNTSDQTLINNFKVQRTHTVDPAYPTDATKMLPVPAGEVPIVGIRASTTRMISFKATAKCRDKENKLVDNCLPEWSKFQVTINGSAGLGGVNGLFSITIDGKNEPLDCNVGVGCTFVFSTNDSVDTDGPDVGIISRQMCQDKNNSLPSEANTVAGWVRDDIGLADLYFYQKRDSGNETILSPFTFQALTPYWSGEHKYDTSAITDQDVRSKVPYTFGIRGSDLSGHSVFKEFTTPVRPGHCCDGIKNGNEIDIDCGGDCGACDGAACATDMNAPATCSNNLCASQSCILQVYSTPDTCKAAGYADGTTNCCLCRRLPVITGVFPVGGFCSNNNNTACLTNANCGAGNTCNLNTPNGAVGNFVTIVGRYFGAYDPIKSKVSINGLIAALASTTNPNCTDSWQDDQIIAVVPPGATGSGLVVATTSAGFSDDSSANPALPNFLVNTISRPGICKLDPNTGKQDDSIIYSGIKLTGNSAYFGNLTASTSALNSVFTDASGKQGTARVPNIQTGRTSTFVMKDNIYSNYLDFTKLAEPYAGPIISSFDPAGGATSTYVTINGRGFGATRGTSEATASQVYFGSSTTGKKASYDFPAICADSIWSDRQVIVKVPAANPPLVSGDYIISMKIAKGNGQYWEIDTSDLRPAEFTVNSDPLKPGLCKIIPVVGKVGSQVNLWGEYFGARDANSKVRFQLNKEQSGNNLGFWGMDSSASGAKKPDKATTTVPVGAITGPVKVVKNGLAGNGINFKIGVCSANAECGANNLCCSVGTPYVGECKTFKINSQGVTENTEQALCFPEIKSCVYEWNFTTSGSCSATQKACGRSCCDLEDSCDAAYNSGAGKCDNISCPDGNTCGTECCAPGVDCIDGACSSSGSCPANKPVKCTDTSVDNGCCSSITNCKDTNNDGKTECADPTSCSGYGNQCNNSYFCPNSPGQCSTKAAGGKIDTGVRCGKDACGELSICKGADNSDLCSYNAVLNKCQKTVGAFQTCDSSRTINDVERKPVELKCGQVDNKNVWYYDSNQTCITTPAATYTKSIDKTKCLGSACTACSAGFTCSHRGSGGEGVCAVDIPVCPAGSTCRAEKCEKDDTAGCECCCDISQNDTTTGNNPGCCAPLTCGDTCGAGGNFGLCTGCTVAGGQAASNEACNCTGTSGKFCDMTGAGGKGTCKDCAQLTTAQICTNAGVGTCCVDAKNNNACRGGEAPYGAPVAGSNDPYNYCAYYACNTAGSSATCSGPLANSPLPTYKTLDGPTGCNNQCVTPPQFGETCLKVATSTKNQICDLNKCADFSCINEDGSGPVAPSACGTCCCDPSKTGSNPLGANYDKCKKINDKFTCLADKGNCANNVKKCDTDKNNSISPGETSVCSSDSDCAGVSCILNNSLNGKRGLCCGCSADNECGDPGTTGCGSDTCCEARPEVVSTVPLDGAGNNGDPKVCRNTLIQATFNKLMRIDTFTNNVVVVGAYGISQCPAGTTYLTAAYKPTILARINFWLAKVPVINKLFTAEARAATVNFCKVPGTVSGYNTVDGKKTILEFKMQKVLDPNKIYYVIIKGNSNLANTANNGVLSEAGIGMVSTFSGQFNGLAFPNAKVWSFTTKPIITGPNPDSGICQIDSISINPNSYLFRTFANDSNLADDDPSITNPLYDTKNDRDKVFRATASSTDGQAIVPIAGVYNWTWEWSIDNQAVVKFNGAAGTPAVNSASQTLVAQNVKDASTLLHARTTITQDTVAQTTGMIKEGIAPIYVFLCANPWPTVVGDFWSPWRDAVEGVNGGCVTGVAGCENTNFELHYCRDAGGPGTADDLPAILDKAVVRGKSVNLKCSDPAGSCANATAAGQACTYSDGTSGTGKCQIDILKELFFLREGLPVTSAALSLNTLPPEGGAVSVSWNKVVAVVADSPVVGYKIYYGTARGNYTSSIDVGVGGDVITKEITGLTNGKTYYFAFTSYNAKKAESDYSNVVTAIPVDSVAPAVPNILWVLPIASSTAVVGWTADKDSTATGTVSYKVCYGATPVPLPVPPTDSCGGTVNVTRSKCLGSGCTATITNLKPGSSYDFSIVASDAAFNHSATSSKKSQIMIYSERAKDLLDISKAFYSYADKNGGKFPNSVPPGTHYENVDGSCLGVPTGEKCWEGYIHNLPRPPNTVVVPDGVPGNTTLMNAISPFISKIPLDPKAPRGVGDAYIYYQGNIEFDCGNDNTHTIYKGNWIIYQPDRAFAPIAPGVDDRDYGNVRCGPLSSRYTCCVGLGCGLNYYCVFKVSDN